MLAAFFAVAHAIAPKHSWDTLGQMAFVHTCNESGLFSGRALDTLTRFPMVTVEKGQGFNAPCPPGKVAPCAEDKIIAQLAAVKARDPSIATIFYMNSVLSWYFYNMDTVMHAHRPWQLNDSTTGKPVLAPGDKHFNPPKEGMLVFAHHVPAAQTFWIETCLNATRTGLVDGCFSDSSQPDSHGTGNHLNATDRAAFEAAKVATMSEVTAAFGGKAGSPYPRTATGTLIGKKPPQEGINALQIETFKAEEGSITELMDGVSRGYLVQAHTHSVDQKDCADAMDDWVDVVATFLIGAGEFSFFGSGLWISDDLADVERRWCADLFERPLGPPRANATKSSGVWTRSFASGTKVTFDTKANRGAIEWAGPAPPPPPPGTCDDVREHTGISGGDVTPGGWKPDHLHTANFSACCALCVANSSCAAWCWYTDGSGACHFHDATGKFHENKNRISGSIRG